MVKVKVCGITSPEDARVAAGAGANAIGLVFAESPRRVGVEEAMEVAATLPEGVLKVWVLVNEEPDQVLRIAREVELDYAQLHGDEGPEVVTAVREGGAKIIKALRMRDVAYLAKSEQSSLLS